MRENTLMVKTKASIMMLLNVRTLSLGFFNMQIEIKVRGLRTQWKCGYWQVPKLRRGIQDVSGEKELEPSKGMKARNFLGSRLTVQEIWCCLGFSGTNKPSSLPNWGLTSSEVVSADLPTPLTKASLFYLHPLCSMALFPMVWVYEADSVRYPYIYLVLYLGSGLEGLMTAYC